MDGRSHFSGDISRISTTLQTDFESCVVPATASRRATTLILASCIYQALLVFGV
jgi:hypothetical protein